MTQVRGKRGAESAQYWSEDSWNWLDCEQ